MGLSSKNGNTKKVKGKNDKLGKCYIKPSTTFHFYVVLIKKKGAPFKLVIVNTTSGKGTPKTPFYTYKCIV